MNKSDEDLTTTTSSEADLKDPQINVHLHDTDADRSRIDGASPGDIAVDETTMSENVEEIDAPDSRIDKITLPPNDAAITITSPSPSNETYTVSPEKFVEIFIYNCISVELIY